MKVKDSMVVSTSFNDIQSNISVVKYEDGSEYWSLNDLNKFFPSKRLDNFLANDDIKEFIEALQRTIIPGKSGIITKRGKGGGTYAHRLVAMRFAAWLSKEFELMVYLSYDQTRSKHEEWSYERTLTKYEYALMTDAIQSHIAPRYSREKQSLAYATEAMMLNEIIFGQRQFDKNPREYATTEQLTYITMLERYNATFIEMGLPPLERQVLLEDVFEKKRNKQLK